MDEKKVRIYFTSDIHGYFYPTSYGDMERKAMGLFGCASQFERDKNTLILDGGDLLQGSAFAYYCKKELRSPEIIANIMNDCGYDYYTLGNHDFNYGQEYQKKYIMQHKGKCVCENLEDEQGDRIYPWQLLVLENGIRVGIAGIVTDYVNMWEQKENLTGIKITNPFDAAKKALEEMRGKTDLTICIYHGGFECDLDTGIKLTDSTENIGYRICRELDFDILLTGHQHQSIDGKALFGTYMVQPKDNGTEFFEIVAEMKHEKWEIVSRRKYAEDRCEKLEKKYSDTETVIQNWLDQPAGYLDRDLLPEGKIEMAIHGSPIAEFLNQIQLYFSHADVSVVGLANDIKGFHREVSLRDIIATYPYPNTLVVCEITGAGLKAAMERSMEYFEIKDGKLVVAESFLKPKVEHYNYDYYAGVTYEIHPENAPGSRVTELKKDGKIIREDQILTLCLNNYRFSGAGGYPMYQGCRVIREINQEMVELILTYFEETA